MDENERDEAANSLWSEVQPETASSVNKLMEEVGNDLKNKKAEKQKKKAKKERLERFSSVQRSKSGKPKIKFQKRPVAIVIERSELPKVEPEPSVVLQPPPASVDTQTDVKTPEFEAASRSIEFLNQRIADVDPSKVTAPIIKDLMSLYSQSVNLTVKVTDSQDKDWLTTELNKCNDKITEIRKQASLRGRTKFFQRRVSRGLSSGMRKGAELVRRTVPEAANVVTRVAQASVATASRVAPMLVKRPVDRVKQAIPAFKRSAEKVVTKTVGIAKQAAQVFVIKPVSANAQATNGSTPSPNRSEVKLVSKAARKITDSVKDVGRDSLKWISKHLKGIAGGMLRFIKSPIDTTSRMASTIKDWLGNLVAGGAIAALFVKPLLEGVDKALVNTFGEDYVSRFISFLWDKGWKFLYEQVSGFFAELFKDTKAKELQEKASLGVTDVVTRWFGTGTGKDGRDKETPQQTNQLLTNRVNQVRQYEEDAKSAKKVEDKKSFLRDRASSVIDLQRWVDYSPDRSISPATAEKLRAVSVSVPKNKVGDVSLNQYTSKASSVTASPSVSTTQNTSNVTVDPSMQNSTAREGRAYAPANFVAPEVPPASKVTAAPEETQPPLVGPTPVVASPEPSPSTAPPVPVVSNTINQGNQTVTAAPVESPPMEGKTVVAKPSASQEQGVATSNSMTPSRGYSGQTPSLASIPTYVNDNLLIFNSGVLT